LLAFGPVAFTAIALTPVLVAATVLELAALAVVRGTSTATSALVATLWAVAVLALTTHTLHATRAVLGTEHVAEEVLLNFLEAALLTLLVQFLGGHPELDGEGASAEGRRLIEGLDGPLGEVDVLVENEVLAVGSLGVEILALAKLDRDDGSDLFKATHDLLLADLRGDVLNEQVGLVSLTHATLDGGAAGALSGDLVLTLGDVALYKQEGASSGLRLMHFCNGGSSGLGRLKRYITLVGKPLGFACALHMSRLNLTKLGEHRLKLIVISALDQTLDEEVKEFAILLRTLLLTLMIENLYFLTVEFELAALRDRQVCRLLTLELNVAKAPRLTVGEELELARADGAKRCESVVELLLSHADVDELHHQISLGLHKVALLHVAADVVVSNLRVVNLSCAPTRL